jgi:serine/threonine protein kinase
VKHEGTEKQGFSKTRLGTPMYMAPEIESGKPYQGADADVFAFGTMLFVSKCIAYPWEHATKTDKDYIAISSDKASNEEFWRKYLGSVPTLTNEFKDVVNSAVQRVPTRATLADVLGFAWMKKETMTKE